MHGTTFALYAKNIAWEVIGLGRAGSLVDWEGDVEQRAYVSLYTAEQIINWRVERVNGRTVPTLIVLRENSTANPAPGEDPFAIQVQDQIRVLKLVPGDPAGNAPGAEYHCEVEIWRQKPQDRKRNSQLPVRRSAFDVGGSTMGSRTSANNQRPQWELVQTRIPLRLGKPLPLIPFVFHGPRHSRPDVDRLPLCDIIAVNLDH
jgi:hypothetical protein